MYVGGMFLTPSFFIIKEEAKMQEIWKDVVGHEGFYQVSNIGRVKSLPRTVNNKFYEGKILSTKNNNAKQYEKTSLHNNGKTKYYKVHQLVARAFIPNPENKREVNHIDGNKHNNKVENLEWVTSKENKEHNHTLGLVRIGERHQNSILNEETVIQIKMMLKDGISQASIARHFNLKPYMVNNIKRENTWKYLKV